jgi:D-amino-acid dehydrogenase
MKVAVVGGGIIGLTSTYHLLKLGHEVTVLDAGAVGAGASHGNAGWIVPAECGPVAAPGMVVQGLKWMLRKDSPLYIRPSLDPRFARFMLAMARRCNHADFRAAFQANLSLALATSPLLDAYAADGVEFEIHQDGLIMAFADQGKLAHHRADLDIPSERGLAPQVLTGAELAEREPALNPGLAGGIYFPHERHVRPDSLVGGLAHRCRDLGARFIEHTPVRDVVRRGPIVRSVITPGGSFEADHVLLAAGAHCAPLAQLFGVAVPVWPGKGYSIDYSPSPVPLKAIVNLCDAKVAVTPLDGALRLAGTMEFAGLDNEINQPRVSAIRAAAGRYFVDWPDPTPGPAWAGARPMTPDGMPIIGALPGTSNAWIATGHGMLGVTMGPPTGRAIADAIDAGSTPELLAPFSPRRFLSRRRRRAIDTTRD